MLLMVAISHIVQHSTRIVQHLASIVNTHRAFCITRHATCKTHRSCEMAEAQWRARTQLKGEEILGDEARVDRQWNQNEKEKGGRKGIEEKEDRVGHCRRSMKRSYGGDRVAAMWAPEQLTRGLSTAVREPLIQMCCVGPGRGAFAVAFRVSCDVLAERRRRTDGDIGR